ncbi:MAG: cryptochrome/photolyase family protein, partial [Actinomycetes bacterium]
PTSVLWFRRDLRLTDHPALLAAADAGPGGVLPLFVVDPALWGPAGTARRAYLARSLAALDAALGGHLHVRYGDPRTVVAEVSASVRADSVHVSADFGPYGSGRDAAVATVLAGDGRRLVRTGSPYAVSPGRVRKDDGTPYRVFTPYFRAWSEHGWRRPAGGPPVDLQWLHLAGGRQRLLLPDDPGDPISASVPPGAGEAAALLRWQRFRDGALAFYAEHRDRPDLAGTSALSAALRWGEIHPRTLLADMPPTGRGPETFRKELAWREFYADVLHHDPGSARLSLRPALARLAYDHGPVADRRFAAWCEGRTGYPFVDAGMRQLRAEGWMHNRVRMVVASFLVKDLHLDWIRGARWFMQSLVDGDLASNQHGWQWVAGTGTDAAPYFRVFNPVGQGRRFDPDGVYVRRYVCELADLAGPLAHEPWRAPGGGPPTYPERIVDHAEERAIALQRYADVTAAGNA